MTPTSFAAPVCSASYRRNH